MRMGGVGDTSESARKLFDLARVSWVGRAGSLPTEVVREDGVMREIEGVRVRIEGDCLRVRDG